MEGTIGPAFRKATGSTFLGEAAGSDELAQMILSRTGVADVFISASPAAVDTLLTSSPPTATWGIEFARDALVLAFNPNGPHASLFRRAQKGQIPWYDPLLAPGVTLGRTDPALDPKGASTLFLFQLADATSHGVDLYARILGSAENPQEVFPETALEADLMAGQIDAAVLYRSEAVGAGIPYVTLPADVNLGDPALASTYARASWRGPKGLERGAPIIFVITIPKNAPHERAAIAFVKDILSGSGRVALEKAGLLPMVPVALGTVSDIPRPLTGFVKK